MVQSPLGIFKFFQHPYSVFNSTFRNQFLVCVIVNILTFAHGISLGWTAPTVRKIIRDDTPLSFPVTLNEASWMASITALGAMVGNLVLCNSIDFIGRKPGLFFIAIPHAILWILVYLAPNIETLCVARFIGGICGGGIFAVLPIFVCEIADICVRGVFQAFLIIALNFGMLIGYILASKLDFYLVPALVIVFPILYFILLFLFPETPNHLLRKNKDEAAFKSFCFYKNSKQTTQTLVESFEDLKAAIIKSGTADEKTLKDFFTRTALAAYGTGFVLLILSQFSGIFAFVTYMSNIFEISGAPIDSDYCTIIMGVMQLFGNFMTLTFVERYGRKCLLIISSIGTIFGLISFGFYTHLKPKLHTENYSWIPLVQMIFIIFIGNIGLVSVTNISLVEILPAKIRSTAFSGFIAILSILVFSVLKVFPIFINTFGIAITMWSCAAISTVCLIYVIIFLPETKNKSMEKD